MYDPAESEERGVQARWAALATQRELKRRYYMVLRARDASVFGACLLGPGQRDRPTVYECVCLYAPPHPATQHSLDQSTPSLPPAALPGIVVGTLGVSRYLRVVASVRGLIERAGRKAYTLVVGKLNPAKLANFAEVGKGERMMHDARCPTTIDVNHSHSQRID